MRANSRKKSHRQANSNPTILIWKQYCAFIWYGKQGWCYEIRSITAIQAKSMMNNHSLQATNSFKEKNDAVKEARGSLAWIAWRPEDSTEAPAIILCEEDKVAFTYFATTELRSLNNSRNVLPRKSQLKAKKLAAA